MSKIKEILSSSVFHFVFLRYLTLGIQFVNSILIAKFLGSENFGVYSFLTMVLQYTTYMNMGVGFSLNVLLSLKKGNARLSERIWRNTIYINNIASVMIVAIFVIIFLLEPKVFEKFEFSQYILYVVLTALLVNYNGLYSNLYRIYGGLREINFWQVSPQIITLLLFPFFREKELLKYWIIGNLAANFVSFLLYVNNAQFKSTAQKSPQLVKILLAKGVHLLLYNLSFYLITLSVRTFIGFYYSVSELGYFTFANSIANSIQLAGNAFLFLFFPKMINRLGTTTDNESVEILKVIRNTYGIALTIGVLLLMPITFLWIEYVPEMLPATNYILILLVSQTILINNVGNSSFLIARAREVVLTKIGFLVLLINLLGCYFSYVFGWGVEGCLYVICLVCIIYTVLIHQVVKKELGVTMFSNYVIHNIDLICIVLGAIFAIVFQINWLYPILLVVYIVLNFTNIKSNISKLSSIFNINKFKI